MRRYLLDTGIVGCLIAKQKGVDGRIRQAVLQGDRVGICMPVLGELWAGVQGSASRDRNLQRMKHALAKLRIWPFDRKAAEEYGRVFAELKRLGRLMQQIDIQIAAVAFSLGNCTVVSADSDLADVPGLRVEDWSK
ncbi:MAG TPA: type II toxin-antitoxin system VapC family toxin [Gemmataceae bacterium]|nr:type II toxin-antitoxin system VapC family toxin [Gemmataceae bacterium]